jgi:hypothetical protein
MESKRSILRKPFQLPVLQKSIREALERGASRDGCTRRRRPRAAILAAPSGGNEIIVAPVQTFVASVQAPELRPV